MPITLESSMAAKDIFHDAVKLALEKDGWNITEDPLWAHLKVRGTGKPNLRK